MFDLFTIENFGNLIVLLVLQAVLGFDNLLYISIEALGAPFYIFSWSGVLEGGVNFATCVFVLGGVFLMYTAVKEIGHLLTIQHLDADLDKKPGKSAVQVVLLIVLMNLIFSFDSVLSALAITKVFAVLATAILLSGLAMLILADGVTAFLEKNRMYEVLGLFILLIVGIVLLGESGQAAAHAMHDSSLALRVFGYEIIPMSKTTFYFSVLVLIAVEIIQSRYSRKFTIERGHTDARTAQPKHHLLGGHAR